jgi:hypothetical protein
MQLRVETEMDGASEYRVGELSRFPTLEPKPIVDLPAEIS